MNKYIQKLLVASCFLLSPFAHGEPEESTISNRIDFGSSQIMGQSIKSGAVYLMNRKKNDIDSMLTQRTNYKDEILADFEFNTDDRMSAEANDSGVENAPAQ